MKLYKKIIFLGFTLLIFLYLIIAGFFKLYYENLSSGNLLSKLTSNTLTETVIDVLDNRLNIYKDIQSIYFFNPNIFKKKKIDLIFDLSKNDSNYNDSIIDLVSSNYNVFEDQYKNYRKSKIIYDNERFNIKYKFFGSSLTPYRNGFFNLKIKNKLPIAGFINFNLLTGFEATYTRVFLNYFGKKNSLISENSGKIISASFNNEARDYYMYETFGEDYFNQNFNYSYVYSFRKKTSNSHWKLGSHKSNFDNLYYNLDNPLYVEDDYLLKKKYNDYKKLLENKYLPSIHEKEYYGKFLSLIYLFGFPHQIEGDNEKWIATTKYLLPLYRNEGHIDKYFGSYDTFDSEIFDIYLKSESLNKYKFLVSDDKIRNFRNKSFFNQINNLDKTIKSFDSIYDKYINVHKRYNKNYLSINYSHKRFKNNLTHNIDNIKKYLEVSIAHVIKENDTIKLQTDSFVKLKLMLNEKTYSFYPKKYSIKNNQLSHQINEFKLYFPEEIKNLKIINEVTGDELDSLKINFHNVF